MVQKGTYAELLKSGVDFASLLKKENEEAEPSPVPESPTMRSQTSSEFSVQSQQSSKPLLKDAAAEDQDVSFSFCNIPACLLLMAVQSSPLMTSCLKVKKFSGPYSMDLVELNCSLTRVLLGYRMMNLIKIYDMNFWVYVYNGSQLPFYIQRLTMKILSYQILL